MWGARPPVHAEPFMLVGGNLNNGANAGVGCANSNNALSNANWNIGGRYSGEFWEHLSQVVLTGFERSRPSHGQPTEIDKAQPLGSGSEEGPRPQKTGDRTKETQTHEDILQERGHMLG
ncbi:MAG: hypothetical protein IJI68_00960 [Eggerthellaceae bacterium]|nr:hypothetical protein [Eggerthellaceae bacterium]